MWLLALRRSLLEMWKPGELDHARVSAAFSGDGKGVEMRKREKRITKGRTGLLWSNFVNFAATLITIIPGAGRAVLANVVWAR